MIEAPTNGFFLHHFQEVSETDFGNSCVFLTYVLPAVINIWVFFYAVFSIKGENRLELNRGRNILKAIVALPLSQ